MQKCNNCGTEKEESSFSWEKKYIKRSKRCKVCQNIFSKRHYELNSENYTKYRHKYIERNKRFIYNYLKNHPCIDCGETNPILLEFDHKNPNTKSFGVGQAIKSRISISKIEKEIEKCDVRCVRCHRLKTAKEGNHYCYRFFEEENNNNDN